MRERYLQECIYSMEAGWFITAVITALMRNLFEGTVEVLAFMTVVFIIMTFISWGVISYVETVCQKRR